ncbi:MAG TPA: hypothetical protein PKE12_15615 [Kiritimatiellia bacterium]|nr:hypothetical protein [Kiritimatiellia bacterium]
MNYDQTAAYLQDLDVPLIELRDAGIRALLTPLGARVMAVAGQGWAQNPLFVHPGLESHRDQLGARFVGGHGIGGDRLWLSPEYRYNWNGAPSLTDFSRYEPPPAMDPGNYRIESRTDRSVVFSMRGELRGGVRFEVSRGIALQAARSAIPGVDIVGLRYRHELKLLDGPADAQLGLWSVLQVPAGSRMILPTRPVEVRPIACVGSAGARMRAASGRLTWDVTGDAFAKIALRAADVTGRAAVWQDGSDEQATLLVREFPVFPHLTYGDALVPEQVGQQALQIFDGLGYGELETHSPCIDSTHPVYSETTLLWALAGAGDAVRQAAPLLINQEIPS